MGAREAAAVLVKLTDAAGNSMEISDAALASPFLKNYTDAIGRPAVQTSGWIPARIGQVDVEQGGIYAGLCRGVGHAPDYHLFVFGEDKDPLKWQEAVDWANDIRCAGHSDYALPTRKEQAVLFGNVPELFQEKYYWSCETASAPAYAWCQRFFYGTQSYCWKDGSSRARAVRRKYLTI